MEGVIARDINPKDQPEGQIVLAEMYFKIKDGYEISDLTDDIFKLRIAPGVPTGIELAHSGAHFGKNDPSIFGLVGFQEASKTVESITIKNNPTTTTYTHGDEIDLTGGKIEVTYANDSTAEIDMTDEDVQIVKGSPADINDPTVTISYGGKEATFGITVNNMVIMK